MERISAAHFESPPEIAHLRTATTPTHGHLTQPAGESNFKRPKVCESLTSRRLLPTLAACGALTTPVSADWRDDIGHSRLQSIANNELPLATSQGLTQVEALENGANYTPNTANSNFTGKSFNLKSGLSSTSNHATFVAQNFYGNTTSLLPGATTVDLYHAESWLSSVYLQPSFSAPRNESRAVQNHSWIAPSHSNAAWIGLLLDFAINRDGFVSVVGVNNGNSTTLPDLLCQTYHTISVGLSNGAHSAGFTTLDGSGRIKPDIVAPNGLTSFATPMVSSAAGLLHEKLIAAPHSLTGSDKPRVIKALLLASATKNHIPSWSNSTSRPLDIRYGAGQLNIHHAYHSLRAGRATASNVTHQKSLGWAAETVAPSSSKTYHFTIPQGTPATPFSSCLTWHRVIINQFKSPSWGSLSSSLADLNLRLYQTSGFTLGPLLAESLSTVDNVELVHRAALAPGTYAMVVENNSTTATAYALAWHSLPAVSITSTHASAREIDLQPGTITITRRGDTSLPLYLPLTRSGSALPGTHFQPLPASITIPAGQTSASLSVIPIADEIAQGNREVVISLAADFASLRDPLQTGIITIEDKPFDAWRFAQFTTNGLNNPQISSATADPDGDQLENLIEYALDLDPNSPNAPTAIIGETNGHLTLSASKNITASDITWAAEVSADLAHWSEAFILTNNETTFQARDILPTSQAARRMIRLRITRP